MIDTIQMFIDGKRHIQDVVMTPLSPADLVELIDHYHAEARKYYSTPEQKMFYSRRSEELQQILNEWSKRRADYDKGELQ